MDRINKGQSLDIELSVVVPVWNDKDSIEPFLRLLSQTLSGISNGYEVIFCVDPSSDGTEAVVKKLAKEFPEVKALFFAARAGQPASTMAGLSHAKGNAVIVIDVDLQDPIELIPKMIEHWREGKLLVIPHRTSRSGEPLSKRFTAALGYSFLEKFGNAPIPRNTGDFRLMDRSVVERVLSLRESHVFLRGLVSIVDQNPVLIDFVRPPRAIGKTKYNKWFGGIRSGLNGLVSFSSAFLDGILLIGIILGVISFAIGSRYLFYKLSGHYVPAGNAQIFVAITFIGSMQLIALGAIGLYIARIFEEVKSRPRWFIRDSLGIEDINFNDVSRSNNGFKNGSL
jgi:glycosyltransferase involved in cell wall biosynthesis